MWAGRVEAVQKKKTEKEILDVENLGETRENCITLFNILHQIKHKDAGATMNLGKTRSVVEGVHRYAN